MAKELIDIYVEQGYPYDFTLDFNDTYGNDLENDYTTYFYNKSIGTKSFSVILSAYTLALSAEDTGKISSNLEEYSVYAVNNTTSDKSKLLSGRIILDKKVSI